MARRDLGGFSFWAILITILIVVSWTVYHANESLHCSQRGGVYVKSVGGYACVGMQP